MSKDWVKDIEDMHNKFGVHDWVGNELGHENNRIPAFLKFRLDFLKEELNEAFQAFDDENPEEIVDAMIDLCVVAIGTLDALDVDVHKAWNEVLNANMKKEPGIKPNRPNPLGLPDLMKPYDWKGPDHTGNHGVIPYVFGHAY